MKNIVSKVIFIATLIATVTATLIITTVYINESSLTDSTVMNVAGRERMLSQKITQEILYFAQQPSADLGTLKSLIEQFETGLEDLINGNEAKGIFAAPNIKILERLENAKKLWHPLNERFNDIVKTKAEIAAQSESFLLLTPKFFQATLEVAQMMERRRLPQRMVVDAENQIGLANSVIILASSYLATADEQTLNEFYSTVESYSGMLDGFANTDMIVHGSILALLADNQLLWEGFHDAVIKAVSGKKQLIDEVQNIYADSTNLLAALESMVNEYTVYSEKIRTILQWVQYLFAALLVVALGYSLILIWQIREHFNQFIKHSKELAGAPLSDLAKGIEMEEGMEGELKEASGHINSFALKVGTLLSASEKISKELERISDEIGEELNTNSENSLGKSETIAIDSTENMNKTTQLLSNLKKELDNLIVDKK